MRPPFVRSFTRHPAEVGETYPRHLVRALSIGGPMVAAGVACLIHAVFPFVFKTTASRTLRILNERLRDRATPHTTRS